MKNCFSCGLPNHVSNDCPTKAQGPKCYKCGKHRHVASNCIEQPRTASTVDARSTRKKYVKEISISG
jgi:transposase-like protein